MKTVEGVRQNQSQRILQLLQSRGPQWTEASELAAIALQYCRAVNTLRKSGIAIENRTEVREGKTFGFYRLKPSPPPTRRDPEPPQPEASLFPAQELQRISRWTDPEERGPSTRAHLIPSAREAS
ncbi:MAG TPA: hypothetical protein VK302_10580 [Terriglobales bacterium]|nr:hypothetical protein [Terriglobales bacterium]